MENQILVFIIGVVVGVMFMGMVVWFTMPSLMLIKHKSSRDYTKSLEILNERLQQKQDWHIINITDYKESTAKYGSLERVCSMSV